MTSSSTAMHEVHNLCDPSCVVRMDDQHHTISAANATQASLHLLHHPNADLLRATEVSLHYPKENATRIATQVPLHHHSRLNAVAGAAHMAKRLSVPLQLHHQNLLQAIQTGTCEKDCDDVVVPEIGPVAPLQMMSRGSIPVRHIDNPTSRQVTFSKRRNGLLKKAYELSILCGAEVGVIVFSGTGRLSEFASTSMPKILERYQEHSSGLSSRNLLQDVEFWRHEVGLLREKIFLQKNLESYLLGQNLLPLDLNEIQKVEHRLEIALNKIRFQKLQLLQTELQERHRHEARLKEENDLLKRKLSQVTILNTLREQTLMGHEARKIPGDMTTSSMHQSSTLMRERECPSASSTFINRGIDEPLKLQLRLEQFPTKPAAVSNQSSIIT